MPSNRIAPQTTATVLCGKPAVEALSERVLCWLALPTFLLFTAFCLSKMVS